MLCKLTRIITKSSIIKRLPPKLELPAAAALRVILTNSIFNLLNEDPNQDRARKFIAAPHLFPGSEFENLRDYISQTLICESLTLALTLSATSASAYLRSTPQGVGRRSIECMDARNGINSFGSRNSARGAEKTSSDAGEVRR